MAAETDFSPDTLPTPGELAKAAQLQVVAEDGAQLTFGSLLEGEPKAIVVFIRHFHCCVCQDFISQLAGVRKDALAAAGVKLLVIGCGEHSVIPEYKETTSYPYPIYADPKKELYVALGMTRRTLAATPKGEEKKSYVKSSYLAYALRGALAGPLKHPVSFMNAGDIQQLGGEFIFESGLNCTFVSRMKHTADHMEVADLMAKAGVEYP